MAILNGESLGYHHSSCIQFLYRDAPLVTNEAEWPARDSYESSIVFELAVDMLESLCSLDKAYSRFDIYEITNISMPDELQRLLTVVERWREKLAQASDERIREGFEFLFDESSPSFTSDIAKMRGNLTETINYLTDKIRLAMGEGRVITVIGI